MDTISGLSAHYKLDGESAEFLRSSPKVVLALFEALEPLEQAFGERPVLSLDVLRECCSRQLFVKIHTPLKAEQALERLNRFDRNWWFNVPPCIHNDLEFTLEFV